MVTALDSYRKIQDKFGLPHIERLQTVFQFEVDDEFDIHEIRNEIGSRLFDFTERVIEPLLWSNHHCHIIEREMLSSPEGEELFAMYKQIQALRWRNNLLTIKPDEASTAEWIRDMWAFWKTFEAIASNLCIRFSEGWKTLTFKEVNTEYQG